MWMIWAHSRSGFTRSVWPALLVVLGVVLVPSACILWFMTEALHNERMAVRQKLSAVYRQDLENGQKRLDEHWLAVQAMMASSAEQPPAEAFARMVERNGCGGALVYREGRLAYPVLALPGGELSESTVKQAMALQAEARTAARDGKKEQAIGILSGTLQQARYQAARDASGRLIAPDAALFAVDLLEPNDARRVKVVQLLASRLRDYGGTPMLSAQRLFLMKELASRSTERFATAAAEEISLELLERMGETPLSPERVSHEALSRLPGGDLWVLAEPGKQAIGVWSGRQIRDVLAGVSIQPAGAQVEFYEDGISWDAKQDFLVMPLGRYLPRWFVTLRLAGGDPFAAAARRQEVAYLWIGGVGIAAVTLLGAAMAMYLRRQMELTRMKNDLTATVSHELKTPLASMRVLVDTLLEGRYRTAEQQKEYLGLISRESIRLSRLVDNFLTFSRMERNKQTLSLREVSMAEVVKEALEAMGERAGTIGVELAEGLPAVEADRDALATVVVNLLDNAWKYSEGKPIDLKVALVGKQIQVAVKDRGIGIARRHQRRIFQRFYQVDQTLARKAGGCGLGLSIVRYIVEAHGGQISVESQMGVGSTFTVLLPVMAKVEAEAGNGR